MCGCASKVLGGGQFSEFKCVAREGPAVRQGDSRGCPLYPGFNDCLLLTSEGRDSACRVSGQCTGGCIAGNLPLLDEVCPARRFDGPARGWVCPIANPPVRIRTTENVPRLDTWAFESSWLDGREESLAGSALLHVGSPASSLFPFLATRRHCLSFRRLIPTAWDEVDGATLRSYGQYDGAKHSAPWSIGVRHCASPMIAGEAFRSALAYELRDISTRDHFPAFRNILEERRAAWSMEGPEAPRRPPLYSRLVWSSDEGADPLNTSGGGDSQHPMDESSEFTRRIRGLVETAVRRVCEAAKPLPKLRVREHTRWNDVLGQFVPGGAFPLIQGFVRDSAYDLGNSLILIAGSSTGQVESDDSWSFNDSHMGASAYGAIRRWSSSSDHQDYATCAEQWDDDEIRLMESRLARGAVRWLESMATYAQPTLSQRFYSCSIRLSDYISPITPYPVRAMGTRQSGLLADIGWGTLDLAPISATYGGYVAYLCRELCYACRVGETQHIRWLIRLLSEVRSGLPGDWPAAGRVTEELVWEPQLWNKSVKKLLFSEYDRSLCAHAAPFMLEEVGCLRVLLDTSYASMSYVFDSWVEANALTFLFFGLWLSRYGLDGRSAWLREEGEVAVVFSFCRRSTEVIDSVTPGGKEQDPVWGCVPRRIRTDLPECLSMNCLTRERSFRRATLVSQRPDRLGTSGLADGGAGCRYQRMNMAA